MQHLLTFKAWHTINNWVLRSGKVSSRGCGRAGRYGRLLGDLGGILRRFPESRIGTLGGATHVLTFLQTVMRLFPYPIGAIKTDNHVIFTNWGVGANKRSDRTVKTTHALDRLCAEHGIVHYLIGPGKPAQNDAVERSHRSDQESFYDRQTFSSLRDLIIKFYRWNKAYNRLEHCGLGGLSPMEYLEKYATEKPPNVRT